MATLPNPQERRRKGMSLGISQVDQFRCNRMMVKWVEKVSESRKAG